MTSAKKDVPSTTSEHRRREALIRDLYAIAAFYVSHPELPAPETVSLYHRVSPEDITTLAGQFGAEPYGRADRRQMDTTVPGTSTNVFIVVSGA